jgi:hypothetical protein
MKSQSQATLSAIFLPERDRYKTVLLAVKAARRSNTSAVFSSDISRNRPTPGRVCNDLCFFLRRRSMQSIRAGKAHDQISASPLMWQLSDLKIFRATGSR